jgi:hypothetical protein
MIPFIVPLRRAGADCSTHARFKSSGKRAVASSRFVASRPKQRRHHVPPLSRALRVRSERKPSQVIERVYVDKWARNPVSKLAGI